MCVSDFGPRETRTMNERIRDARAVVSERRADLESAEALLSALLVETGRRPGDGSDQPALFCTDDQGRLFG